MRRPSPLGEVHTSFHTLKYYTKFEMAGNISLLVSIYHSLKSAVVLNSNMREKKEGEEWAVEKTRASHVIEGEGGVKISLGGYMSDERNMFRDGTFKVREEYAPVRFSPRTRTV